MMLVKMMMTMVRSNVKMFFLLSNCDRVLFQDGNGYIDRRELALMMRFIGEPVTQEEIDVRRFFSASFRWLS